MIGIRSAAVRPRTVAALALVATTSGLGMLALTAPASAGLTTYCEGSAGAVTVPGDLVVAAGKSCTLDGTKVTGGVTVQAGANLVITGGEFSGGVTVGADGFFDAQNTKIAGDVVLNDAYGSFLSGAPIGGSVKVSPAAGSERVTYTFVQGVNVKGGVSSTTGEFYAENSTVDQSVTGTGVKYLDLSGVVVGKDLTVSGAAQGSVFCAGEVYGNASFTGNAGTLQLGADGPVLGCTQASYWGGNLTVSDNNADVRVSNNIVRGNLAGTGNSPAPTGENNRVRGTVSGQFENLQASASAMAARSADRSSSAEAKLEQRRAEARAEAGVQRAAL
ncbi:hypothetical protein [Amycolatopsis suaedae]|uniref:Uncharacterized protein n=1 Tax=Amycolatopsis suaedae TaxID=2510978 RepID=A0A4Q7J008_9PSEU|nr:hypothetical protein [Amycolatopsis suaedae]RZQ59693.1 hypothetical protein EWH70_33260 [Amycolatopsis suaedae]